MARPRCAAVFERLSAALERQRDAAAATDWREFLDADRAFHAVTLEESGNAILSASTHRCVTVRCG